MIRQDYAYCILGNTYTSICYQPSRKNNNANKLDVIDSLVVLNITNIQTLMKNNPFKGPEPLLSHYVILYNVQFDWICLSSITMEFKLNQILVNDPFHNN